MEGVTGGRSREALRQKTTGKRMTLCISGLWTAGAKW